MSGNCRIKWQDHESNQTGYVFELFQHNKMTDCILSAQGRSIHAHRVVLAAASPYFYNLLKFAEPHSEYPLIMMSDLSFSDVLNVLMFVYTGKLTVEGSQLSHFLLVAKNLGLVGIPNISIDLVNEVKQEKYDQSNKEVLPQTSIEVSPEAEESPSMSQSTEVSSLSPASTSCESPLPKRRGRKRISYKVDEDNKFKCPYCPSTLLNPHSIYNHQRYCLENPNRSISRCPICKQEVRPGSLQYHKSRHHGYKPRTKK